MQINIIFSALRSTINELGSKASALRNHGDSHVTNQIVKIVSHESNLDLWLGKDIKYQFFY